MIIPKFKQMFLAPFYLLEGCFLNRKWCNMKIINLLTGRKFGFLSVSVLYVVLSVFFLFGLIVNSGDVAQGDWGTPLTATAAFNDFSSRLFVHSYNGFGEASLGRFGFPFFQFFNAVLAPLGFVGGAEIKILSVFLVALGGITTYILARSFRLGKLSSFLAGLFFMSTPVVFNWLMFGWIYYILAYDLFPLMVLTTKKFIETNQIRYALVNGLILIAATSQPAFLLVFPTVSFLFVIFECKGFLNAVRKGLALSAVSLSVWFLSALSFFTSYNNGETLSFYHGDYFGVIQDQFRNFANIINPTRLWGSTYNFQFETYFFHLLIILSFAPVVLAALVLLWRPKEKRVLFFFLSYLFALLAYLVYDNMQFLVFNLPLGGVFEAPSVFLVPASLGLAFLIGYFNNILPSWTKFRSIFRVRWAKHASFLLLLVLVISVGIPWWSGQASGDPIRGPTTKLNLYSMPSGFTKWSNAVSSNGDYFVLYVPLDTNLQIRNSTYFSQVYEGINMGAFTEVNNLPYVSVTNSSLFLGELMSGASGLAEQWGSFSVRYVVVYTDVLSAYDMSDILTRLSMQEGLVEVEHFPGVVVFENEYARLVVYTNSSEADAQLIYNDPTLFKVQANSTVPFTIVFNQVYSGGWQAWVNTTLQDSAHFKDPNGFNSWQIEKTGNMTIDIYYEPQTSYRISTIISIITLIAVLVYLLLVLIRKKLSVTLVGRLRKV